MAEEKILTINIRKDALKTPKSRRGQDAASILRRKLSKFSKGKRVVIGQRINAALWGRGVKYPALKMRVKVTKNDDGSIFAEMAE